MPKISKISLPGVEAQQRMAPEFRSALIDDLHIQDKNPRHAAVVVFCYPKHQEMHLALILRPSYDGVHSDQIALPGGKAEKSDANYQETALRELWEEIGVPANEVHLVRALTKTYVPVSNFWVHPFLGYATHRPEFVAQPEEVAKIIEMPFADLLNEHKVSSEILTTSYVKEVVVPAFKLEGYRIWGATAMMLSEFKVLLKTSLKP